MIKTKKLIPIPRLLKKTQTVFNKWIRERDKDKGCISCGAEVSEAGHYYSQGHHSSLRFNEVNANGQCTRCNCWLSGNLIKYRNGLLQRYTEQQISLLDSVATRNPIKKWSRFELEEIIKQYK
jgi:hypothetical protein